MTAFPADPDFFTTILYSIENFLLGRDGKDRIGIWDSLYPYFCGTLIQGYGAILALVGWWENRYLIALIWEPSSEIIGPSFGKFYQP